MEIASIRDFFNAYQRILIFDTEFTSWEGAQERNWTGEHEHREIIQIAAVKVDLDSLIELDAFESYVKPRINLELSDYIKSLTHISQAGINNGIDFEVVYQDFMKWSENLPIFSYSGGGGVGMMHPTADGSVLKENIDLYELAVEYPEHRFYNIAEIFKQAGIETKEYSSGSLYAYFDIQMDPNNVHNAMHDVRSLEYSLFELKKLKTEL